MKKFGSNHISDIDVVFPIVHGTNVEDGALQGYIQTLDIPYVGCDVLSSAIGMDKYAMKILLKEAGFPVLDCCRFSDFEAENIDKCLDFMENHDKEHFDIIVTHDAPAAINDWFSRDGYRHMSTCGQKYLEVLRKELDFDSWIHGHMHFDMDWPDTIDNRMYGIYEKILLLEE